MDKRRSTRRAFLRAAAAWPALAWTGAVFAQSKQPILIGWLHAGSRESGGHLFRAFKEGLAALGWKEGTQVVIEERWADGRRERLQPLAQELAAKKPAVIVASPVSAAAAATKAAPNTPVIQAQGSSPVELGLAASFARPGGMVTGVTNIVTELAEKYLELLLAAAPKLRRIGFLIDSTAPNRARHMESARRSLARYVANRWPVIAGPHAFAEEGALLTYSSDTLANYRRAAYYVDRILKERTAKAIGLTISQDLLFRADKVIE